MSGIEKRIDTLLAQDPGTATSAIRAKEGEPIRAISDLPVLNDIDADYSPQYVKLARILRDKIKVGELVRSATLPATGLATDYHVSAPVAYAALEMLAANRYVARPAGSRFYRVTWDAGHPHPQTGR
jgi:hypothetical protein